MKTIVPHLDRHSSQKQLGGDRLFRRRHLCLPRKPVLLCIFSRPIARIVVIANDNPALPGRRPFFLTHNRRASLTLGERTRGKSETFPTSAQVLL
jgi:hypothetical protein